MIDQAFPDEPAADIILKIIVTINFPIMTSRTDVTPSSTQLT